MKTKKAENNDLINKGIMLGIHFSTVLFDNYFTEDFQRRLNTQAPLKGVLLMVIADLLVGGDQNRGLELFDWATGTHLTLLDELDPELIEKCIRAIERSKVISN